MGSADHSGCLFLFVGDDGVAVGAQRLVHLRIAEAVADRFAAAQFFLFHCANPPWIKDYNRFVMSFFMNFGEMKRRRNHRPLIMIQNPNRPFF